MVSARTAFIHLRSTRRMNGYHNIPRATGMMPT